MYTGCFSLQSMTPMSVTAAGLSYAAVKLKGRTSKRTLQRDSNVLRIQTY
jgi:hypothetical protein